MSIPHRYVTPDYLGAAGWDYFNVISGGVGGSGSAYMDDAKIGGPNAGTYAVAFGEDATSSNANRGLRALAQNCDVLDDRLHRAIAVTVRSGDATAVGAVSTVTLPTATFLGVAGTPNTAAGLNLLFEVLDSSDNEILDASGAKVKVNTVTLGSGDLIGGGGANGTFSGNTVQLNISPSIPTGTVYRIYYGTRSSFWDLPEDALTNVKIRGAQEVEAGVEDLFRRLHGNNLAWNAAWSATVFDLARGGLMERYMRANYSDTSPPESYFSTSNFNSAGGAWIVRQGPAVTVYSLSEDPYTDPMNGLVVGKFVDENQAGGSTGFVVFGARKTGTAFTGEGPHFPGAASFMALWPHAFLNTIHATDPYTRIIDGATALLTNVGTYNANTGEAVVQVTQAGNYFRTAGNLSSISLGYDLLDCTFTSGGIQFRRTYVVVAMGASDDTGNATKVRVRQLDGQIPDFTGTSAATIRWVGLSFGVGDGAGRRHKETYGYGDNVSILFDGLFFQVPQRLSNAGDDDVTRVPARFVGERVASVDPVLQWGGFQYTQPSGPVFGGTLWGDGSITTTAIRLSPGVTDHWLALGTMLHGSFDGALSTTHITIGEGNPGRQIINLPNGATFNGVRIAMDRANTGSMPGQRFAVAIGRKTLSTGVVSYPVAATPDPTNTLGPYEAFHQFDVTFSAIPIDNTTYLYWVEVLGELPSNTSNVVWHGSMVCVTLVNGSFV